MNDTVNMSDAVNVSVTNVLTEGLPIQESIIKVMGVGGGGCNAINYLYKQGIEDVTLLVCNTDKMSLAGSSVPSKLQLGTGLGVGGRPALAKQYAEDDRERIKEALSDGTKMLFLTAGMGGGTGTGASPIVAEVAKELGILTVGIVTIPFAFEGVKKIQKAMDGVAELSAQVDAILVINNEKLRQIYPDLNLLNAFSKSDDVVANAARSIAEIITKPGYINTDFTDVYNTLKDGGSAIMSVGTASGENRVANAIHEALHSPLISTEVNGATRLLLQIYCSTADAMVMSEIDQIHDFVREVGDDVEVQWGAAIDEELGESVRVTIIATGFDKSDVPSEDSKHASIKKYYETEDKPKVEAEPEPTDDSEQEEDNTPREDEKSVEIKLDVPQPATEEESEVEEIVIELDEEDYTDDRPGTLFSGWMRGRR